MPICRNVTERLSLMLASANVAKAVGGHTARVTPVPIPNTEVKPRWADRTASLWVWESR